MAFFDFNAIPGLSVATTTAEQMFLWGRHEQALFRSAVIKSTSTDPGNANGSTEVRAGMIMAQVSNKWVPYNPIASDGSQIAAGVLALSVHMTNLAGGTSDRVAVVVVGGPLKTNQLLYPAPVQASTTLSGVDPQARAQLAQNFTFDDVLVSTPNSFYNIVSKGKAGSAGTYTVTAADSGTIFTTTSGDTTSTTFTLPKLTDANSNPICKGCIYRFYNTVDLNMVVTTGQTADKLVVLNDSAHVTATFSTSSQKKGAILDVTTDETGTFWLGIVGNAATATMS